jgi:hypothetical protein
LIFTGDRLPVPVKHDQHQVGGAQVDTDLQRSVWKRIQRRLLGRVAQRLSHPTDDRFGAFESLEQIGPGEELPGDYFFSPPERPPKPPLLLCGRIISTFSCGRGMT